MDSRPCKRSQGIQEFALSIKYTLIIQASGHKMIQMLRNVWFTQLCKSQNSPYFQICSRQWTLKSANVVILFVYRSLAATKRSLSEQTRPSVCTAGRAPEFPGAMERRHRGSAGRRRATRCVFTHTPQCGFDWTNWVYTGSRGEWRTPPFSAVDIFKLRNQTKFISKSSSGALLHLLRCISFRSECFQQHQ